MHKNRQHTWPALAIGLVWALAGSAVAQQLDPAAEAAVHLLRRSTQASRSSDQITMLQALHQLRDPALTPLFDRLAKSPHLRLKIHGVLALAEVAQPPLLDLTRVMEIDNTAALAELVGAALDKDLLNDDQAVQMLNWSELETGVKVILASHLIKKGLAVDQAILRKALEAQVLGQRALGMLLLLQTDDAATIDQLTDILDTDDAKRDQVRAMLLGTVIEYGFERAAPWAEQVRAEPGVDPNLALGALRAGLRFANPAAVAAWRKQYDAAPGLAHKTRLGIIALQSAPWLEPSLFDPLIAEPDETGLLSQIGRAGAAIAGNSGITDAVIALIQLNHPVTSEWALNYARREATDDDAQAILLGLILAFDGPDQHRVQRFARSIAAAQNLYERNPDAAAGTIRAVLTDPQTSAELARAVLFGLIQTDGPNPHAALTGLPPFADRDSNVLALILLAKHGQPISERQKQELALLVRGGGGLQDALRVQAAWAYLKQTHQEQTALAKVLAP
ncbi:MAG: hypothetical protein V3U29_03085 [Phycisphaeraceae bacterium]